MRLQGSPPRVKALQNLSLHVVLVWHAGPKRENLRGGDFDCGDIPDAAMTLAVVAAMANGPTTIRNVESWRFKETERMKAIVAELGKLGVHVRFSKLSHNNISLRQPVQASIIDYKI